MHTVTVIGLPSGEFYARCQDCDDRSDLEPEVEEAEQWRDEHRHRSRFGNMNKPHTAWKRETAAKIFRERSTDPRWDATEQILWAQLASELERPQTSEDRPLF